jgi:hypothetical protein
VHRSSLSSRHTGLSSQKLGDDSLNGSSSENSEGVASVGGDHSVVLVDGRLHTDGDGFLKGAKRLVS